MANGQGVATLDFGSTPAAEAQVDVTGQTGLTASSLCEAFMMSDNSTGTNTTTDHDFAGVSFRIRCGNRVAGVGFTIYVLCLLGLATGQFKVPWCWNG